MKWIAALPVAVCLFAQTERPVLLSVTAVRHWALGETTRVAIEISGEFEFRYDRLHDPERVYYDILNAQPRFGGKRLYTEELDNKLVNRIRVAETQPGITRVVLYLSGPMDVTAAKRTSPNQLVVELRQAPLTQGPLTQAPFTQAPVTSTAVTPAPVPAPAVAPPSLPAAPKADPPAAPKNGPQPVIKAGLDPNLVAEPSKAQLAKPDSPPTAEIPKTEPVRVDTAKPDHTVRNDAPLAVDAAAKAARRTSAGETSLVRALGLKIQRVVIDPGHGGHDEGTQGAKGLLEKDLVLDVALRVGKLIQDHMGAEVIYTRSDDTFIPLEGRTALANEKKADLFLSIHANSSPFPKISGMESFYLNFTDSKDALDVASRENASAQKSIFELRDLIQQISLHDKAEESREFANRVQTALYGFSARNFPAEKNRGVKKAPFVVLIGANMPSVLAEIGFLSNPREEALLKKSDYRQKLAEALYRGVSKYADSLSHFQTTAQK